MDKLLNLRIQDMFVCAELGVPGNTSSDASCQYVNTSYAHQQT